MRVKFIGDKTKADTLVKYDEYVVIEIYFNKECVEYRIRDDDNVDIDDTWCRIFDASLFEITCGKLYSNWICLQYAFNNWKLTPKTWIADDFWDKVDDDFNGHKEREILHNEIDKIVEEAWKT